MKKFLAIVMALAMVVACFASCGGNNKDTYFIGATGLSPAELAMSYALSLPGVTSLVLGSETTEQVQDNIHLAGSAVQLTQAQMAEIRENFLDINPTILNPGAWPKAE